MAVCKLTKSKKAVLFIDDDGRTYITSVNYLIGMINNNKSKYGFILLNRLPTDNTERFKPSPLYDPDGIYNENTVERASQGGLSPKAIEAKQEKEMFKDKKVDW